MASDLPAEAPVRRYANWPHAHIEAHDPVMRKLQYFSRNVQQLTLNGSYPSAKHLADACGIPASTITRIIRGEMIPTGRVIANIEVTTGEALWPNHRSHRYGSQ
ncbi:helix-turn-helix transcriptional regulator [Corynebacterium sp. KPL2895]|uniref:helix-turn-helix transcriptional regulator n=1 Tax=unclassified Corynebacterium TaxID=2624378 RepID=UPI0032EE57DF